MLALCSMLSESYYAQNYAGIISLGLLIITVILIEILVYCYLD